MYKVSVVVPIYNVEKYIVRCAESLFSQTLDDIQFIFVDDASPDKSVSLLEQTLERFPQRKPHTIILHHARNMGLPTARATGLERVEAPYVAHCDSDDYVELNMYETLYECAIQNNSDMVICGRTVHSFDGREYTVFDKPVNEDSVIINFLNGRLTPLVWPRLTRTCIYRQVLFPVENYLEDWVQMAQLLTYSKRIMFLNESLYHYVKNPLSISNDMSSDVVIDKMHQCITNFYLMHDFVMKHHSVPEKVFVLKKESIRQRFLPLTKQWNVRMAYLKTFPELNISILFNRSFSLRHRLFPLLVLLGLYPVSKTAYDFIKKVRLIINSKLRDLFQQAGPNVVRKKPLVSCSLHKQGV